jgi:hypothetical protein
VTGEVTCRFERNAASLRLNATPVTVPRVPRRSPTFQEWWN